MSATTGGQRTGPATAPAPRVSLLMPNHNNGAALELVLERLAHNTTYPNVELIVVDDGSTDQSLEILRRWRNSGRFQHFLLEERKHGGVVEALNAGLAVASGEVIVQLDADASIETPGWVEKMLALLYCDERVGAVTARIVFDTGEVHAYGVNVIAPEGLHDRGVRILEPPGQRRRHWQIERPMEGECETGERVAEVDAGVGCCLMYRRALALEVGGYDPGFAPVWFDDVDLCLSFRHHDRKVFFLPDVLVCHRIGLRHTRPPTETRGRRLVRRSWGRLRPRAPRTIRRPIDRATDYQRPGAAQRERLEHHFAYWERKWGFDPLNPDLDAIRSRYGDSEICWALDPRRRAAGEEIAARYGAAIGSPCE